MLSTEEVKKWLIENRTDEDGKNEVLLWALDKAMEEAGE